MTILMPQLSIGGLTALLCAIIAMLIPLTIWALHTCEGRRTEWLSGRMRKPARTRRYRKEPLP